MEKADDVINDCKEEPAKVEAGSKHHHQEPPLRI